MNRPICGGICEDGSICGSVFLIGGKCKWHSEDRGEELRRKDNKDYVSDGGFVAPNNEIIPVRRRETSFQATVRYAMSVRNRERTGLSSSSEESLDELPDESSADDATMSSESSESHEESLDSSESSESSESSYEQPAKRRRIVIDLTK